MMMMMKSYSACSYGQSECGYRTTIRYNM